MLRFIVTCLALFPLWMGLSGHFSIDYSRILYFGFFSCLLVAWITHRMGIAENYLKYPIFIIRSITYIPYMIKEVIVSNIDMAKIILSPSLPIEPTIFRTKAPFQSDLGLVTYANSITLTPGTVSIDTPEGEIEVHSINKAMADGVSEGQMRERVLKLEKGL